MYSHLLYTSILILLLTSCSANLNEHEVLFNNTKDSLAFHNVADNLPVNSSQDSLFSDYLNLNYKAFKNKYGINHKEMDEIAQSMNVSISIVKAMKQLEENTKNAKKYTDYYDSLRKPLDLKSKINMQDKNENDSLVNLLFNQVNKDSI